MNDRLISIAKGVFSLGAFLFVGLAVWEKLVNQLGRTLVFIGDWYPFRLLELAAICLLFVIALQLHEIRKGLVGPRGSG
jgi:hypothetical protein